MDQLLSYWTAGRGASNRSHSSLPDEDQLNDHSRMLKKSASFVLASFRPLTYPNRIRLGPSPATALLDGHLEYPARMFSVVPHVRTIEVFACQNSFPTA